MIKARMNNGDLILGLSSENLKRLKKGQPIKFSMAPILGVSDDLYIMHGETESDILDVFAPSITPETKLHPNE